MRRRLSEKSGVVVTMSSVEEKCRKTNFGLES